MSLGEVMSRHSERQMRAFLAYLDMELERPSRADWYQMQTAAEVRRGNAKDPSSVDVRDMVLRWQRKNARPKELSREEQLKLDAFARAKWFAALGFNPDKKEVKAS